MLVLTLKRDESVFLDDGIVEFKLVDIRTKKRTKLHQDLEKQDFE
jgi:sRNA-binding carbon storage regulator CsrA